jgi:hypothetical protein
MVRRLSLALLALAAIALAGCSGEKKGPAYAYQDEFRKQLDESRELKERGYSVHEVRFSEDFNKALVLLIKEGASDNPKEVVLEHDGFRRYKGQLYDPVHRIERRAFPPTNVVDREQAWSNRLANFGSGFGAMIVVTLPAK